VSIRHQAKRPPASLRATDDRTVNDILYDLDGHGQFTSLESLLRSMACRLCGNLYT
jgi:hypothetical protein